MTKKTISDAVTNISAEYIEKAADYSAKKKSDKPVWFKLGTMAACLALVCAIGIPMLNNRGDRIFLSDASKNVNVKYTDNAAMQASISGDLIPLTEEELFTGYNTAVFKGTVMKISNIEIDYNGFTDYRAIAEIRVDTLYRGDCKAGDTVSVLLPCSIQENVWVEDTGVVSRMREGTVGIFMPKQYDETSITKMNGAVLALNDIADYGFPDGERYAFLETSDGIVFDVNTYKSIADVTTLDEVAKYVENMVSEYSYVGEPVRGGVANSDETNPEKESTQSAQVQ